MIYENVELHNVEDLTPLSGGVRFQRVPEEVRRQINEKARLRVLNPDNCEIRLLCGADGASITVSSEDQTDAWVFYGTFDGRERYTVGKNPVTIRLKKPRRLDSLDRKWWKDQPISPKVCRIVFGGPRRSPIVLHEVAGGNISPPKSGDLPGTRYLAYGTSITHGHDCAGPHLSYAAQTAWHLKADLINLGVGGSCHCEKAFADHIARREDWDIASLALSVNMQGFKLEEFRKRVEYMVNTVTGADTTRPVACITLYPYYRDFGLSERGPEYGGMPEEYRQILRETVEKCPNPNAYLVEGPELLTDIGGLTADIIHPSDNAMIEIGYKLAGKLRALEDMRTKVT